MNYVIMVIILVTQIENLADSEMIHPFLETRNIFWNYLQIIFTIANKMNDFKIIDIKLSN